MIWIFLAFGAKFIGCWIRIRIRNADPGDKSNPDPEHCLKRYFKKKHLSFIFLVSRSNRTHTKGILCSILPSSSFCWAHESCLWIRVQILDTRGTDLDPEKLYGFLRITHYASSLKKIKGPSRLNMSVWHISGSQPVRNVFIHIEDKG